MRDGLVMTIEPFLSRGGAWARSGSKDKWNLYSDPAA